MRRLLPATLVLLIAVPLFATEPNPSARQRELVEKLLAAMKIDDTVRSTIDAMYAQMEKQFLESAEANGTKRTPPSKRLARGGAKGRGNQETHVQRPP